jgi:competence protein ComEC
MTLALAPLTLLLFGQVSLIGLVANAVAIPWVTGVITPLSMAGVLYAPVWNLAAWAVQALAWVLAKGAALSWATFSVAQAPLWAGMAGVCGGVLLVMPLPWRLRLLGLPLMLPVLLWQAPRPDAGEFDLLAMDIGQGNAVLVQTATHALLFDAGPSYSRESDAGHRVLVPLLRSLDVRLDTVMISHRDSDHTGGAPAVLAMQPQAQLISSIEDAHPLQTLRLAQRCMAGQHWVWDGVHFEVLHPRMEDYDAGQKSNAMSCVLRVGNGRSTVLLVGDIERPQEAQLLAANAPLKADVLLVPHHGSKTSSSAPFLDAVSPTLALVQAGYRNRFHHPAPVVLARYAERGIRVVESARCGAAHWQSVSPYEVSCQREVGMRYWQHRD